MKKILVILMFVLSLCCFFTACTNIPSEKNEAIVSIEHYQESLDGTYELKDTDSLTMEVGDEVTEQSYSLQTYEGFTLDTNNANSVVSGNLSEDGLTIKLYYKRNVYSVTFMNGENNYGDPITAKYGAKINAPETAPKDYQDDSTVYEFNAWYNGEVAWDFENDVVVEDLTLDAKFVIKSFTVQFVNGEIVLQSSSVESGTIPEYSGETPTKNPTEQYTFTFDDWDKEVVAVTGDVIYNATFTETLNKYIVTFKNGDSVLQSGEVDYGTVPVYQGETPTKAATAQYTYTFDDWDKEVVAVTGNVTYIALFNEVLNKYTITFMNGDAQLQSSEVAYGTVPVCEVTPTKESTTQYSYTFNGWDKEVVAVSGNATYNAQFSEVINKYIVTFINGDAVLQSGEVDYGTVPVYQGETPTKAATVQYTYTFDDWDKEVVAVTGNVTYTALFNETVNTYTLTWGTTEDTTTVTYGQAIGTLHAIAENHVWMIGSDEITALTIWNYGEDQTAIDRDMLITGFEYGEEYTATGYSNIAIGGTFNVNELGNAYGDQWLTNEGYNSANALRFNVGGGATVVLKVKMNEVQQDLLSKGGTVTLYARSVYGAEASNVTINSNPVESAYLWGTSAWQEISLGTMSVDQDGYITINIAASYNCTHVMIDDITVVPVEVKNYTLTFGEGGESISVPYGTAIGNLPELPATHRWTIDGVAITAETIWNYGEDKTAYVRDLSVIGFEYEVYGVDYTVTNWRNIAIGGTFNVNEFGNAYGDQWLTNEGYTGANALRLNIDAVTSVLKVKMNEVQQDLLSKGGSVTLYARSVYGAEASNVTINSNLVTSAYLWGTSAWQEISLGTMSVDQDGYITINIAASYNCTHVMIDDITVVPAE